MELAKILFCETGKRRAFCGVCLGCRHTDMGVHPDLFVLEPEKDAQGIKIAAVRELIAKNGFKPVRAACKVFIIDRADLMNEEAQNALLKTLEEPAGHALILLLACEPESLLPTVRSRLQSVGFHSSGSPVGETPEMGELRRRFLDFATAFAMKPSTEDRLFKAPELPKVERETLAALVEALAVYFRDALVLRAGAGGLADTSEFFPAKKRLSEALSEEALMDCIEQCGLARERLRGSLNTKLVLAGLWEGLAV